MKLKNKKRTVGTKTVFFLFQRSGESGMREIYQTIQNLKQVLKLLFVFAKSKKKIAILSSTLNFKHHLRSKNDNITCYNANLINTLGVTIYNKQDLLLLICDGDEKQTKKLVKGIEHIKKPAIIITSNEVRAIQNSQSCTYKIELEKGQNSKWDLKKFSLFLISSLT